MNSLVESKQTRLETAVENNDDIPTILDGKVAEYQQKNMPVESAIADYIALGINGQKEKIEQYKQYKKDLDEAIKAMMELTKATEEQVYSWMQCNGLEKLKGIHCSSVTLKDSSVSVKTKIVRDITDEELLEKGLAHKTETITDINAGIKINKKRVK